MAAAWGAGRGRQSERVSAAGRLGVRAGGGGGRRAGDPAALLWGADLTGPAPAFASRPLAAEKRRLPLPTCWGPRSPPAAAPSRPRDTPQIQEWFGPQPHRCLFCEPGSHTVCDTPSPSLFHPLKWPGAEPRLQLSSANGHPASRSFICISGSCRPMARQHPPPLPRGGTPGGLHHSWDPRMGGKRFRRGPGDRRVGGLPIRQSGSSAEEGVLALEEAEQPAVRGGILDDLLDL